jgi:hypothetical protein
MSRQMVDSVCQYVKTNLNRVRLDKQFQAEPEPKWARGSCLNCPFLARTSRTLLLTGRP